MGKAFSSLSVLCLIADAVPFAGRSSVEGNFPAPYGGFRIDFCFMDKIIEHHKEE
jgi:hypothetical protein